jgi:hypothetical protein
MEKLIFLDLKIFIAPNQSVRYKSYQKLLNLYLYLPPRPAHPQSMLYSLVYDHLCAYWLQNVETSNFIRMAILLRQCLYARGYSLKTLLPVFQIRQPTN